MNDAQEVQRRVDALVAQWSPFSSVREFLDALFDAGLASVDFEAGHGGLGADASHQQLVVRALRSAGAPEPFVFNPIGVGMAAPTIVAHGTPALRDRLLRPLFNADEIWCQLFSEPDAGSDLASVTTVARRDGDEWIVDGQKVWTSLAHLARWGMLLARTDPTVPKHRGLTYFIVDMHAPGIEVRPLRQITGDAEFNEVFLSGVRIPDAYRVGDVGAGWSVAITTLMNERVSLGGDVPARGSGPIAEALRIWANRPSENPALDRVRRDRLARCWIEAEVLRLTNLRASESRTRGTPGPEGSVGKLRSAELNQEIYELCLELLGADAALAPEYVMSRPTQATVVPASDVRRAFLRSRANTIEGGTSEILRNVLAERVLGLPPEARPDKHAAFNDTARRHAEGEG